MSKDLQTGDGVSNLEIFLGVVETIEPPLNFRKIIKFSSFTFIYKEDLMRMEKM